MEKKSEVLTHCPNCRNHCRIDALRCARGRQWKMIQTQAQKKDNSVNKSNQNS